MTDPNFYIVMATASLTGLGMLLFAGLAGWRGWLQLKHDEISSRGGGHAEMREAIVPNASARIEIADLKERIRKLEAIAAGVDL